MKIGCHISVAKGLFHAANTAHELGAESFQIFTKSPRSLRPKKIDYKDAERGVQFCNEHGIDLVAHTPYITNLSTPDPGLREATVRSIREDLSIAAAYGAVGAVVHCGKHVGEGEQLGIERMIETLDLILEDYDGKVKLLLENTAGQGSELGLQVETLVAIRQASRYADHIGFCFDTCHAFAAGIWNGDTFNQLVEKMKYTGYLSDLYAIHFNDSKAPFASHKDRHEKIGQGEIGAEALTKYLQEEAFSGLPIILETPVDDEQEYGEEMSYLHRLKKGA